ncbi:MAG: hypothetical protein AAGF11_01865 [Myxococcota bacterium]
MVDSIDPQSEGGGGGYGILLVDVTGSMNATRVATGNTRCHDSRTMAQGVIAEFFDPARISGDGLAIWAFTNDSANDDDNDGDPGESDDVQPTSVGYYTDEATATAAIAGLTCGGSTPLADAMCKALNGDGETFTLSPLPDQLFILTDGVDDNSNGPCAGISGSTTTPGSWQSKVFAEMTSTGIVVDTRYWIDPIHLLSLESIDSLATEAGPNEPPPPELPLVADAGDPLAATGDPLVEGAPNGQPIAQQGCDASCQELALCTAMAEESGGSCGIITDNSTAYPLDDCMDPLEGPVPPPAS